MAVSELVKEDAQQAESTEALFDIVVERGALIKALSSIQGVVERRNAIPVLGNVKIIAEDNAITLTGTDMDMAVTCTAEAKITNSGATTIPAHTFYDIVRKLPDQDGIHLEMTGKDGGHLSIRSGSCHFSLPCLPVDEFPVMENRKEEETSFTIPAQELKRLLDRTRFSMSTEETRYYLNGIYLHASEQNGTAFLRAVATDGHRLSRVDTPLPEGVTTIPDIIIPRKTVTELRKLMDSGEENVTLHLSKSKFSISYGSIFLISKVIDGDFPNYSRAIPENNDKVLPIDVSALSSAVDRVSIVSSDKVRSIRFQLETDKLTLSVSGEKYGMSQEEIPVPYEGEKLQMGFNARYLLEVMSVIERDTVTLTFSNSTASVVLCDDEDPTSLYVIMPMRV